MIIIIPIGGSGERFKNNGYKKPKALINIFGKPILFYLLDSINVENIDYIYIPYNKEYLEYNLETLLKKNYPHINFKFHLLLTKTRGAAETINIAINNLESIIDKPVICLDSDNFYLCDIINKWDGNNTIFTFIDKNVSPIYSYISTDKDNNIIDIVEKEKISDSACSGAYGFESIVDLERYTRKIIDSNIMQQSEYYTSGVVKEMLKLEYKFKNVEIDIEHYICVGTPIQLKLFYNNYPKCSSMYNKLIIESKRICFDLDNTLVTYPTILNDYTSVKPIIKNINLLKYLKNLGNTIIIYTARRMKTHNGNIGKINSDIGKITFDTLDKFKIPYDEIYFGKPYADFYIDDLAINCFDDMEKELGFYNNKIEPRNFNSIEANFFDIIIKKGTDLSGEIYYFNNMPENIKDLFPIYLGNTDKLYTIEKIKGLVVSELYTSELLTMNKLEQILNSIIRIQTSETYDSDSDLNVYLNYSEKLKRRYNNYDYSKFTNCEHIYEDLLYKLNEYESNNSAKITVIHGDPVFTNIIINNYDKIKFIDMRGKVGNTLTIFGDWLYDWAKIYQSLVGYDEILISKKISGEYKQKMINGFEDFFIKKYSEQDFVNLKLITKSLLFSLIPLHDNEKCNEYFDLIMNI